MLEKYSKNKSYMFIRKRKTVRRKRKAAEAADAAGKEGEGSAPIPEDYQGVDEEETALAEKDAPTYAEHAFTFQAFEKVCSPILLQVAWDGS